MVPELRIPLKSIPRDRGPTLSSALPRGTPLRGDKKSAKRGPDSYIEGYPEESAQQNPEDAYRTPQDHKYPPTMENIPMVPESPSSSSRSSTVPMAVSPDREQDKGGPRRPDPSSSSPPVKQRKTHGTPIQFILTPIKMEFLPMARDTGDPQRGSPPRYARKSCRYPVYWTQLLIIGSMPN